MFLKGANIPFLVAPPQVENVIGESEQEHAGYREEGGEHLHELRVGKI